MQISCRTSGRLQLAATAVSFQQIAVAKVVSHICKSLFISYYITGTHSILLSLSFPQVNCAGEIDGGVTHVLIFETCGNAFSACVHSQIERVTHERVIDLQMYWPERG